MSHPAKLTLKLGLILVVVFSLFLTAGSVNPAKAQLSTDYVEVTVEYQKDNGDTCEEDSDCLSGYCVDGYCCDTACSGDCDRCDISGSEGTCTVIQDNSKQTCSDCYYCSDSDPECDPVPLDSDPNSDCTNCSDSCSVETTCDGAGACQTNYCSEGTACSEGTCSSENYCNTNFNYCSCTGDGCYDDGGASYVCQAQCDSSGTCDYAANCSEAESTDNHLRFEGDLQMNNLQVSFNQSIFPTETPTPTPTPTPVPWVGAYNSSYSGDSASIQVVGNTAYFLADDSSSDYAGYLAIVDVTDPSNPTELSVYYPGSSVLKSPSDADVVGNYAYIVAVSTENFLIVNVNNPSSPTKVYEYDPGMDGEGRLILDSVQGIDVDNGYAYLANDVDKHSLLIFDVSNPESPSIVYENDPIDNDIDSLSDIFVVGNYAYAISSSRNSLLVIDVSDRSNPNIVGECFPPGGIRFFDRLFVSGNYAYVARSGADDILIVDISDPNNPSYASDYDFGFMPQDVYVSGNYAYAQDFSTPIVLNVSDPYNPIFVEEINTLPYSHFEGIYGDGSYIYIAWRSGFYVLDLWQD